jgi:hypothetical protein
MFSWRSPGLVIFAIPLLPTVASPQVVLPDSRAIPTFGATVVSPFGLRGDVYLLRKNTARLPDFLKLEPVGSIYTSVLNVLPRNAFTIGYPGVQDRYEWFAIDYNGKFWINEPGNYEFRLISDDGSKLYIDGRAKIDNDGLHLPVGITATAKLTGGIHTIRVSYFQGPCGNHINPCVALQLEIKPPGAEWRLFSTDEFKPPSNPEDWKFGDPSQLNEPPDPNAGRRKLRDTLKSKPSKSGGS